MQDKLFPMTAGDLISLTMENPTNFAAIVPGLSSIFGAQLQVPDNNTKSRRDIWGNKPGEGPGPDDPIAKALTHIGVQINQPAKKLRGITLTDQQYEELQKQTGQLMRGALSATFRTQGFSALPVGRQEEIVKQQIRTQRARADGYLLAKFPEIARQAEALKRKQLLEGSPAAAKRRTETVH